MKAGVIGIPDGDFGAVESNQTTVETDEHELEHCIEVQYSQQIGGITVQKGRAALESLEEQDSIEIVDGAIRVQSRTQPVTKYTEFVHVPGKFVAVSSGGGTFAFDLIGSQVGVGINRAEIDLDSYFNVQKDKYDAVPWKTGFYGHLGKAENGVVYGESVLEDGDFGNAIADSQMNQIGLSYSRGDEILKVNVTESGYVEIYQPDNYEEGEFAEFIIEEILTHAEY
jgi:hypothetical protein